MYGGDLLVVILDMNFVYVWGRFIGCYIRYEFCVCMGEIY